MAINIDEGEPGTFKDRYYLERDPHRFIEGAVIAAAAGQNVLGTAQTALNTGNVTNERTVHDVARARILEETDFALPLSPVTRPIPRRSCRCARRTSSSPAAT